MIRLGEHNLKNRNNGRQRVEMKIRKVIQHEEFHFPSLYNDLALVLLETKVILSTNIQPVCLPENLKNENFAGKNATVTGWGLLKFGKAHVLT